MRYILLIETMIILLMFWKPYPQSKPSKVGEYLVIQEALHGKEGRTKWVRFWDGEEFYDSRMHRCGPVVKWADIPDDKE